MVKLFSRVKLNRRKMLWLIEDTESKKERSFGISESTSKCHIGFCCCVRISKLDNETSIWEHFGVSWKMEEKNKKE